MNNQSTPQEQLMQALQGLLGSSQGNQAGQYGKQNQQQFDVNQLFSQLLSGAMTSGGKSNLKTSSINNISSLEAHGQHPVESQATAQAIHNGADPSLLDRARQFLGKNAYVGLCEAFVERMTKGAEGIYKSAIDAWNKQTNKQTSLENIKPGDSVYFAPDNSNGYFGHTGVYAGNNKFISATYNGVKQYDLNDWEKATGQKVLGYVPSDKRIVQPKQQPVQQPIQRPMTQIQRPQPQVQPNVAPRPIVGPQRPMQTVPSAPSHIMNNQPHPMLGGMMA